ncbi:condensation domain-containing protein [Actinocorallia sp. B10E7]|uniref:condensation domain-containing protein n=1 Tax=Actinocorallia sp. B10E7 TaxID=3153558 RepID=UPI00325ED3CA
MNRGRRLQDFAVGRTDAPASYEQEWMLYLARMRRTGTFNMPRLYRAESGVERERLISALESVAANDILRTTFERRNGAFMQRSDNPAVAPEILSLRPGEDSWPGAAATAGEFVRQPLDPYRGPVFRSAVIPVQDGGHVLATVVHHAVADAVTLDEIERRILTALGGAPAPPDPLGYADYAAWQRDTYDGRLADLVQEAAAELSRATPPVLPGVEARGGPPGEGRARSFDLDEIDDGALRSLLTAERVSPFMAGLAALGAALQAMSGQSETLVALEVSTRRSSLLRTALGPFISTVPVSVPGGDTFRARLRGARDTVLSAMGRGTVPYHRLMGSPAMRRLRRDGTSAVDIVYQAFHEDEASEGSERLLHPLSYGMEGAGFTSDLHVSLHESPHGRRLGVGYSPRVPDRLVRELADRFHSVLASGLLDPDSPIPR